jgi:hypothetical protein
MMQNQLFRIPHIQPDIHFTLRAMHFDRSAGPRPPQMKNKGTVKVRYPELLESLKRENLDIAPYRTRKGKYNISKIDWAIKGEFSDGTKCYLDDDNWYYIIHSSDFHSH